MGRRGLFRRKAAAKASPPHTAAGFARPAAGHRGAPFGNIASACAVF